MAFSDALRRALGLAEPADDDALAKQLVELLKPKQTDPTPPESTPPTSTGELSTEDLAKALTELRTKGSGQQFKILEDTVKHLTEENNKVKATLRLTDSQSQVRRLAEGPGWILPIPAQETLLQVLLKAPDETRGKVIELFEGLKKTGLVELKEYGTSVPDELELTRLADNPVALFGSKVERYMSEHKGVSQVEAMNKVSAADPQLYREYRRAVDVRTGGAR
jgi:hypothetical protein